MQELKEVYNEIASCWDSYRKKPFPEVIETAEEWRKKFKTILDIGCGTGRHLIPLVKLGFNVVGIDFSKEMIKIAKNKIKENKLKADFVVADARHLPFKDKKFDCSLAIAVIHHLKTGRNEAVNEIKRITKNEALISVWNKSQARFIFSKKDVFVPWKYKGKTYQRYYHVFTKKEIMDLLKAKLKIISVFPKKLFSKNIFILAKPE